MLKNNLKYTWLTFASIFLASCVSTHYKQLPSANYSFRVKSLVMHFTAVDYQTSLDLLVDEGFVSSHYLIPESKDPSYPYKKLKTLQLVNDNERAWHAGVSYWQGRTGLNDTSIGIEIVNVPECFENTTAIEKAGLASKAQHGPNRLCVFPDFDPEQIKLLIALSQDILARHPDISPTAVVGHSDISPSRKSDPGPRFPWFELYKAGVGAWYDDDTLVRYWQRFSQQPPNIGLLQNALRRYGYGIIETGILDQQSVDTISAFQMHFLPWQVSGQPNPSTHAAVFALIEKYFPDAIAPLMQRYENELNQEASRPSDSLRGLSPNEASIASLVENNSIPENMQFGALSALFPLEKSSSRAWVNNRTNFSAYEGSGSIYIKSLGAESADIYVNEQKLNITAALNSQKSFTYPIGKRTRNGINSIRIENIEPLGSELYVHIPSPKLELDKTEAYDFSKIDALIQQDVKNGFPGAVLLVTHKGKLIKHSAYGYAQKLNEEGELLDIPALMQKDTRFDLASNTKAFATTLALMKLVDQGVIELNASVSEYLPEYSGEGREGRTVADLLSHASGYDSELQFYTRENDLGEHFHALDSNVTSHLLLTKVPFINGRADAQSYSDINFMILGLLIERVSNMALDDYIESQIYAPLQLNSLQFTPLTKGSSPEQFAATEIYGNTRDGKIQFDGIRNYVLRGEVHDEKAYYSMNGVAGHAGLFGNALDLAVLSQLILNEGSYGGVRLFDKSTLRRFVNPQYSDNTKGLGWRLASDSSLNWHFGPYASQNAFGHTGWTGTASLIDPEFDLAVILLTNKKHSLITHTGETTEFLGDAFETGRYGSVMSLVYEAILKAEGSK